MDETRTANKSFLSDYKKKWGVLDVHVVMLALNHHRTPRQSKKHITHHVCLAPHRRAAACACSGWVPLAISEVSDRRTETEILREFCILRAFTVAPDT